MLKVGFKSPTLMRPSYIEMLTFLLVEAIGTKSLPQFLTAICLTLQFIRQTRILLMTLWRPFPSGKFRHQQIQSMLTSNGAFFGHIIQSSLPFRTRVRSVTTLTNSPLTLTSLPANKMKFPPNLRSIRIVSSSTKPFTLPSTTKRQLYDGKWPTILQSISKHAPLPLTFRPLKWVHLACPLPPLLFRLASHKHWTGPIKSCPAVNELMILSPSYKTVKPIPYPSSHLKIPKLCPLPTPKATYTPNEVAGAKQRAITLLEAHAAQRLASPKAMTTPPDFPPLPPPSTPSISVAQVPHPLCGRILRLNLGWSQGPCPPSKGYANPLYACSRPPFPPLFRRARPLPQQLMPLYGPTTTSTHC